MTDPVKIDIYGPQSKLSGPYPKQVVKQVTSYPVQGAQFSKAYRKGVWDGRKHLFNARTGAFPTGLVNIVENTLVNSGISVEVEDHRVVPVPSESGFDLQGVSFEYPYDYQLDACEKMIEAKQGIVKISTNGGKTECACAVTQYLGLKTLFIVSSVELMYQGRERFKKRLGLGDAEVGIVGSGEWAPGSLVTIAMLGTLESRINTPACQDLLKSTEVLFIDECVDEYTIISTETGYKYAKDVQVGDKLLTHKGVNTVSAKSYKKKQGVELTTQYGMALRCSYNHPVAVIENGKVLYKHAGDVKPGAVLLERKNSELDTEELDYKKYVQGLFAGDGHWHTPNKVRWCYRKDFEFWEITAVDCIRAAYPDAIITISTNCREDHILIVESPSLLQDLHSLGFSPMTSKTLNLVWPDSGLSSYIGGLFDAEGCVERTGRLWLQTCARGLMEVVHRYLRDRGILSSFIKCNKKDDKHNTGYRVSIPASQASAFYEKCLVLNTSKNKIGKGKRVAKNRVCDLSYWNLAAKYNSVPVEVTAVVDAGVINTVDFEVTEDHTFVASGLLTHNCHHVGSETWFTISTLCPAYYRFGLSGTPLDRTDGANLRLIAATGEVIVNIDNKFLVDRGISAKAHIIWDKITEPVLKKGIRYPTAYKQGVVENPYALKKVIDWAVVFQNAGLGTLILCEEIAHGRLIDEALWTDTGGVFVPHQFIYGDEEKSVRKQALESFSNGNLPVLIASTILDEGVDVPTIDALILAGSRKSRIRTMQRLGRGLRGKKLIVVEFANFCNKYLLQHSYERLQDYKNEECFPVHYSGPDLDLVKKILGED